MNLSIKLMGEVGMISTINYFLTVRSYPFLLNKLQLLITFIFFLLKLFWDKITEWVKWMDKLMGSKSNQPSISHQSNGLRSPDVRIFTPSISRQSKGLESPDVRILTPMLVNCKPGLCVSCIIQIIYIPWFTGFLNFKTKKQQSTFNTCPSIFSFQAYMNAIHPI